MKISILFIENSLYIKHFNKFETKGLRDIFNWKVIPIICGNKLKGETRMPNEIFDSESVNPLMKMQIRNPFSFHIQNTTSCESLDTTFC